MTEPLLQPARERSSIRRAVSLCCDAVSLDRYRLLGHRTFDLSATGMLLRAEAPACENEMVLVHLFTGEERIVAEAHVARVVAGARRTDPGRALGLRFTRISARALGTLLQRLRGTPPPVPHRRLRTDYAATIQAIRAAA